MTDAVCAIDGCNRNVHLRSMCRPHYTRNLRHGDPLAGGPMRGRSLLDRLLEMVQITDTCWLWTGIIDERGYARYSGRLAHRLMVRELGRPCPDGLTLDHLCRVTHCVNPDHLEAVTDAENRRRAVEARTHCRRGHEYTPENTAYWHDNGRVVRRCVECSKTWPCRSASPASPTQRGER